MGNLPLGNDNDLNQRQFYNRVEEISFIKDNLELAKKGSIQQYYLQVLGELEKLP